MLLSESSYINSLSNTDGKRFNFEKQSTDELRELVKSLNIIDPDRLSKDQLSIILKRIDDYNGFYTTQQLENINYLDFKQHVFFDSAVSKVSYSFDRIQNLPYDQDEIENVKYFNNTDGFTNFLLKNIYPSRKGYLNFDGTQFIVVYDEQGKVLSDTTNRGIGLLNPENKSFSFEFWINPDASNNSSHLIFQKTNRKNNEIENGYICYLNDNGDENYFDLHFAIYIDSNFIDKNIKIKKDEWQHVAISVSNSKSQNNQIIKQINFILDGNIVEDQNVTNNTLNFVLPNKSFGENFKKRNIPLTIGSYFVPLDNGQSFVVQTEHNSKTLSTYTGKFDEFRQFHKIRSAKKIKKDMHKNIFSQKGLQLYLRFNEPTGEYTNNILCIDYSGNKLHGIAYQHQNNQISILSNIGDFRVNDTLENNSWHMKLERKTNSPVLNSTFQDTILLRENLIERAKLYDKNNPNLIFNLMPRHYFLDTSLSQGLPVYSNDSAYNNPESVSVDNNGQVTSKSTLNPIVPANNDLVNIVLIWARFFDKLKMYISSITNILNVDYDAINNNKIIGMQIPLLCKMYGIEFKEILPSVTRNKLNNENLNFEDIVSDMSIRKIQNILWKRFLINTQDFLRSKGTKKSIESVFNSFGIDYKKLIDIKEHSFNNEIDLNKNCFFKENNLNSINFGSGKILHQDVQFSEGVSTGDASNKPSLQIGSISNDGKKAFDKNWSIEVFFNFKNKLNYKSDLIQSRKNQSFNLESTDKLSQTIFTLLSRKNLQLAVSLVARFIRENNDSKTGRLQIDIAPILNNTNYNKSIIIDNVTIFDVAKYFCITQNITNNKITYTASIADVGNQIKLKDVKQKSESIEVQDLNTILEQNGFSFYSNPSYNTNNSYTLYNLSFVTGYYKVTDDNILLNKVMLDKGLENSGAFDGEILKIRQWNKDLNKQEITSHYSDIENIGVDSLNPENQLIFDFSPKDTAIINEIQYNNGLYEWQIKNNAFNSKFNSICKVASMLNKDDIFTPITILTKNTNIKFDEANYDNKVNVISYSLDENKTITNNFNRFPSHEVPNYFIYENTNRVSIDMSIVKVINDDISKIITDLNSFTSKVSNNFAKYEYQYKSINDLREHYFDKFSDSEYINYASLGNIFKYFDNIMSSILYDIVPSKVRFEGFNFVYESHVLERSKYEFKNKDSINSISSSINVPTNEGIIPDSFLNYSRENTRSRRSTSYTIDRKHST